MTEEKKPKRGFFSRKTEDNENAPVVVSDARGAAIAEVVAFLRARGQGDAASLVERKMLGAASD